MDIGQKGNADEQSSETKSMNQLLEKEQKKRMLLQNQQMLSQKQKYNAENNNNNKPQYAALIGQQVPEKSNQAAAASNLKGLENNNELQDISAIANPNNNRGGNHSYQPSLNSNNISLLQQVASTQQMQQSNNQGRMPANPNNKSSEEDTNNKGTNNQLIIEEQQDQQQTFQKRDQPYLNSQAPQSNQQQSFQQQQLFQKQTAFTLGNEESYNQLQQQQQQQLGNNQQFGFNPQQQQQQGFFGNNNMNNKAQLTQEQQLLLLAQQQQANNNPQMNYYDQSAMNNNNNNNSNNSNNSLMNNFQDPNQLSLLLDEMFASSAGQQALKNNQFVQKYLSDYQEEQREKLNKQLAESQLKFLKNNNSNEAKAALSQKEEEIKRLNTTVNQLKEQIKEKLSEIELWKSKALTLNKNASNNANAQTNNNSNNTGLSANQTQVYDQEIKKLSLLALAQQKEIEDLKTKAAANVDGSEKIAQQRVILLNVEIERLKNIIESMKGNNNLSDSKTNAVNANGDNNNGIKRRTIFTENSSKPFNSTRVNAGKDNSQQPESSDISSLRRLLESKISEVDEWRMKFAKLAEQAEERDELEAEVFRLKNALEETLMTRQNQFDNHIQARSQQHFERDSDKVAMLQVELEKLALALREKIAENETLKTQQMQLGQSMRANAANIQVVSSEAQGRNKELAGELQRATEMLREKVRQNEELRSQMNRLEGMLKDKQAENGQIAQRLQFAQGAVAEKQQAVNKIQQADNALKTMRDELEKAQNMLREKMRENESLRQNLQRAMNSNASRDMIDQEMKKYQQALDMKSRECEEWKMRCRGIEQKLQQAAQVEARAKDSENRLRNLMQEIQMLPQKITKY